MVGVYRQPMWFGEGAELPMIAVHLYFFNEIGVFLDLSDGAIDESKLCAD